MQRARARTARILKDPLAFAIQILKAFKANQGLLLAGAVAYYALLSLIPLLILMVIVLSHVIDPELLFAALNDYLAFVVPGQSGALVDELRSFLDHREVVGGVLLVTMIFFSALAFTVLENAMSVIFFHRVKIRRRRFLVSALLPYVFIVFLGMGLFIVTLVSGAFKSLGDRTILWFGQPVSLELTSALLLYLLGLGGEILMLTAIYLVMPVGRLSFRHALIGGVTAALLWEMTRHLLVLYYATMSQIQVVYGSLTTAIAALLSVELGAIVLLIGAQVISEYERIGDEPIEVPPTPMKTEAPTPEAAASPPPG
ncbi:MAG TPA: YihY/virulence factor BrkB family protein [Casimicrobiaceae bacterium]|nr:YihY/virulence factor BrkB family protein [Casimicrobiaceae bacterium]